jgi:two-component system response regulator DevR
MVVDDHDIVRMGVIDFINAQKDMSVVAEASSRAEAIERVGEETPDLVVLDVRLGEDSGIETCRDITSAHPSTKVLMFTSFADGDALESAINAGASGYVLKRISLDELVDGVRRVAAGETVMDTDASEILERRREGEAHTDPRLAKLSPQERRVLALIADGRTNRQIAEEMSLAEKTVKNYVSNLLRKLDMRRRSEAAAFRAAIETD